MVGDGDDRDRFTQPRRPAVLTVTTALNVEANRRFTLARTGRGVLLVHAQAALRGWVFATRPHRTSDWHREDAR